MFKHLLVPLDGSRLAESALPPAAYLASKLGASITLLHVIEQDAPKAVHGEHHLTDPHEAAQYLEEVAQKEFFESLRVDRHVHTAKTKDVAKGILEHLEEMKPDLFVMCAHGRSGLRGLFFGTIAQQVAGPGPTPVMLVRPAPARNLRPFSLQVLLVPLDGTAAHEHGLPIAADLARACMAKIHLVLVVPTLGTLSNHHAATGVLLPGATAAVLELTQQEGGVYLNRHLMSLRESGLAATAEVCRGDPKKAITRTARQTGADLIVLSTHGRVGMDAFWTGSVAPKISSQSKLPLLLVPAPEIPV